VTQTTSPPADTARRSGRRSTPSTARRRGVPDRWLGVGGVVLVAIGWEAVARGGLLPGGYFPPLSEALARLCQLVLLPETWVALGQTTLTWISGILIGTALAVPLGFVAGTSVWIQRATRVVLEVFKPVPPVVFIPPMVLLLGTTQPMKIVLVSYAVFWPVLVQAIAGIENIDPVARRTVTSFRVRPRDRVFFMILPAAWPFVMTGLRIAASLALIATVVTELVGGASGIGLDISLAQIAGRATDVYALILITGTLGLAINQTFTRLERRTLRWNLGRNS